MAYALFVNSQYSPIIWKESGEDVTLSCSHQLVANRFIFWYYGDKIRNRVVTLRAENKTVQYDQWKNRTEIKPSSGDLTIYNLTTNDDEDTYTCWYDAITVPSQSRGSSYQLQVTCK